MTDSPRSYPRHLDCGGTAVEIAPMTSRDGAALTDLVATLPPHDLLFLRRDLSHPKVIAAWMRALDEGELASLVARADGRMVGCTAIFTDALSWSRHVGELRVLLDPAWRGRGLGRVLMQECFVQALALGLTKLVAQMTTDQRAAIAVFEELGFRAEALLSRHVRDRDGALHDLVLMSHDVGAVAARHELYGLGDALGTPG
ncbi:MAG: GNAT family N-acetyltransferase [Roseateles sp.]|uniref:GNAT family N-acetyltransferase n=1 Tax=Roseateles sp. TaxID=1971397 RepID=UPI0039EAEE15